MSVEEATESVTLDLSWGQAAGCSHGGKVRSTNEDRFLVNAWPGEEGVLVAVADGMGGNSAGEIAAQLAIDTFGELLSQSLPPEPKHQYEALLAQCYLADERIRRQGVASFQTLGMGTTLVAAIITPSSCVYLHAGDSRLYHFRQGRQRYRTSDHSIVELLLEMGRIQPEDIPAHPMRSILNSCLGGKTGDGNFAVDPKWNDEEPPLIALEAGDLILLCSDGLNGYLPGERLAALVAAHYLSPLTLNSLLLQAVLEESAAKDNITVLSLAIHAPDSSA